VSPRPRTRILDNLEGIYREAYQKANTVGDQARMAELDSAYQREQLLLEVLLDIRDGLYTIAEAPSPQSALEKIEALRALTKLR
jgi:hypothetical protein